MILRSRVILGLVMLSLASQTLAQAAPATIEEPVNPLSGLEAFVDGAVEAAMAEHQALPGITVSVVKDGEIVLLKGYGLADVESGTPVDPSSTLFRIGSISKTFTGLAVMQMVERGLLNLDADVNVYLKDFQIPDAFDEPITLRHLLSHRSGFEDGTAGHLFAREPADAMPMVDYLARHMPARVLPPGETSTYTNYGITLAGHIVEIAAEQAFADYLDENIFQPLEMNHTTIREPLGAGHPGNMRPELEDLLATGYAPGPTGKPQAKPHDLIGQVGPAGAISSTAKDMAKYMIARLDEDRSGGAGLVSTEIAAYMQERPYDDRPATPDMVYAMVQGMRDGYRFRWHNGGSSSFFSDMTLYPELQLGIFVSTNSSDGGAAVSSTIPQLIFERYFPSKLEPAAPSPPADFATRGQKYAGQYLPTRRSFTMLEKLLALAVVYNVSVDAEGYLLVTTGPVTRKFAEVGEGVFEGVDPDDTGRNRTSFLYFYEDENGVPDRLSVSTNDPIRVSFLESPAYFFTTMGLASLLAVISLLGAWRRAGRGLDQSNLGGWASGAWTTGAIAVLVVVAGLGLTVGMVAGGNLDPIIFEWPPAPLSASVLASNAIVVVVIALALLLVPAWRDSGWSRWRGIQYTAFTGSLLLLVVALSEWNMLGFKY